MTIGLGLAVGLGFLVAAAGAGLLFLSAGAGFLALAAGLVLLTATAERAGGLAAFLSGAVGRLLVRALATEVRDAFDDFAIVRRRRAC